MKKGNDLSGAVFVIKKYLVAFWREQRNIKNVRPLFPGCLEDLPVNN